MLANEILDGLREAIQPDYLGLVSSDGHTISADSRTGFTDQESIASLAASAYGATRQLARLVSDSDFTMMFNEGDALNVHISQVTDKVLLVVCFRRLTDIGKVRVLTNRAVRALEKAMIIEEEASPFGSD